MQYRFVYVTTSIDLHETEDTAVKAFKACVAELETSPTFEDTIELYVEQRETDGEWIPIQMKIFEPKSAE